jgi:outer membrane protein assembly factor BamE (lipoprotein component of BamABCDE complex)
MHTLRLAAPLMICLALLSACTPTVTTRGNLLSDTKLALVQPSTAKSEVERLWGPPTLTAPFNENVWYYAGETTEQQGIYEPVVVKRQIIKVAFDAQDTVASIEKVDPAKAKDIEIVDRRTPTAGKEFTALQQAIGNLGKFNSDSVRKR